MCLIDGYQIGLKDLRRSWQSGNLKCFEKMFAESFVVVAGQEQRLRGAWTHSGDGWLKVSGLPSERNASKGPQTRQEQTNDVVVRFFKNICDIVKVLNFLPSGGLQLRRV